MGVVAPLGLVRISGLIESPILPCARLCVSSVMGECERNALLNSFMGKDADRFCGPRFFFGLRSAEGSCFGSVVYDLDRIVKRETYALMLNSTSSKRLPIFPFPAKKPAKNTS